MVLVGPNGTGKTNFLEGIYWGATLKRFPGTKLSQLLKEGEGFYKISLEFHGKDDESLGLVCEEQEGKYKFQYKSNNLTISRSKYAGQIPVISFLPEDLNLLTHSPSGRRRFLNEALSAVSVEYRHALSQYEKTLKQRNEALQIPNSDLEIWNEQFADFGSKIIHERQKFMEYIRNNLEAIASKLSKSFSDLSIEYHISGRPDKWEFLQEIQKLKAHEQAAATTLIGPHRDDFEFFDSKHTIVGYLSRGQMRAIILALKFLERDYLQAKLNQTPIMLLDDVFSEFDEPHQQALIEFLKTFDQVFLTTAHSKEVQAFLPVGSQIFKVNQGEINYV